MLRFLIGHGFSVRACNIWSHLTLVDTLLDKVRLERVVVDTVSIHLLHPDRLPVGEITHDVRYSIHVPRLNRPVFSQLVDKLYGIFQAAQPSSASSSGSGGQSSSANGDEMLRAISTTVHDALAIPPMQQVVSAATAPPVVRARGVAGAAAS